MRRSWIGAIGASLVRARDEERGLTVVEGVVAALILVLGSLATLQVFDVSTRTTFRAEQSQVLNNRLQAELEAIRQLPYGEIAMTHSPGGSVDPNDPRWRVQDTSFAVDRDGATASLKKMAINGEPIPGTEDTVAGGEVDPGPVPFTTGDISGEIFRFVVWTSDPSCETCGSGVMKRIIVAARVDEAPISFERRFQEVHTDVADPDATPDDNPAPPGEEVDDSARSLWLTDTTCDNTERQEIVASHPAHNTRGRCADGLQVDDSRGAPDLMYTAAPALCAECLPENQELFDYATDVPGSDDEVGLTMPPAPPDSCELDSELGVANVRALLDGQLDPLPAEPAELDGLLDLPDEVSNRHLLLHSWLTPEVGGQGGDLTGVATLELYTRHPGELAGPAGEICVVLFVRQEVDVPVDDGAGGQVTTPLEVDVPFINVGSETNQNGVLCHLEYGRPFFRCQANQWPTNWSKVAVPMELTAVDSEGTAVQPVLPAESRLGVALIVNEGGSDTWLEFMYDAVGFESRLEVQTETVIPFGS